MFQWLKNLFSDNSGPTLERPAITPTVDAAPNAKRSTAVAGKSKTKSKAAKTDLDAMTKPKLLEHAKKKGIKVNASLKKADLVKKIKNA
jgi:4-aminobutyrate aminotransferase-like enzyme